MSTSSPSLSASRRQFIILVLVAGCLIGVVGFGPRSALGLFLPPMSAANGWGREVFSLALAIQMNFLADPRGWFAHTFLNTFVAALLILYDRRVIWRRAQDARGAALQLYDRALARQQELVRAVPFLLASGLVNIALIQLLPNIFLEQRAHLILVSVQIFLILFLIVRTIRDFGSITELILNKTRQELETEE